MVLEKPQYSESARKKEFMMYEPRATGRASIVLNEAISFSLIATSPILLWFYLIAYQDFDASLSSAAASLLSEGAFFFSSRLPYPTYVSTTAYLAWVLLQAALYIFIPAHLHRAPRTPGGRQLLYKLNGLRAWALTVVAAATIAYYGLIDPIFIADNLTGLFATANLYCIVLIGVFYVKARIRPDNEGDTLLTGHFWYDLFNGGELHPRTGQLFDWKHFNASRTGGIITWTLIDLSFAALQHQRFGVVTNAMILAMGFRVIIVVEYFLYEDLFFETLDGAHERFSFYNIYGFAAMMPQLYTLQTQYLARHPVQLPISFAIAVSICFAVGWVLNHDANSQKNLSRRQNGRCRVWGKEARFLEAKYQTTDGKTHRTVLLCSGWWGVVRHPNYVGSLVYTWASCLACGTGHLFPYTEAILVTGTVIHRCLRDEARCREKYGETWDEYCLIVRWRMIPGIF